ncbi:MAG: bifunctional enoyl-CoA hydratase/phosphate acetyltransferase [Oligoflexia bacterium]|nr:bifunctional enoyl-CoA hydratase/phosphate acetyltransferase [Oligoflexia bacterium]
MSNFVELQNKVRSGRSGIAQGVTQGIAQTKAKVVVVVAEDEEVLRALRQAEDHGIASGILVGGGAAIESVAKKHHISLEGFEIVDEPDHCRAAERGCQLIRDGRGQVIMKGLIDTSKFMHAILDKDKGLNGGGLLSHVAVFESPNYPKFLLVTDAAINIAPDLSQKAKIIANSVKVAQLLGQERPLVACCCAVEKVNSAMSATIDAAILAKMSERGQLDVGGQGCVVDGPLAIDNAVNEESARIKKINSPVAGRADIILCNDIESANYLYKSLIFFARAQVGAIVMGATAPVILTSRADSHANKYLSIVLGVSTAQ